MASGASRGTAHRRRYMSGTAVGILFGLGLVPFAAQAQELPTGGSVTSGSATIVQSGSNLVVNQSSQNAILSWQSFSVGGGSTAHFANGTGATLNRVTGSLPSSIDGSLTATGSLYLINPAGVAVGTGGMVRTGGSFIASTHDATDADFLDGGDLTLRGDSKASVVNRGFVTSLSGDVVLTARRVENAGTIEAPNGSVGLLGGYEVELRDTSLADGKFAVKVGGADTQVVNSGTVRAAEIEMRANGGSVQALAGNTKAIVKAMGVKKTGGRIFLTAGNGGTVKATQKMVARRAVQPAQRQEVASLPDNGPLPTARPDFAGGEVHIAGGAVSLGGTIDATGSGADGGTIMAIATNALTMDGAALLDASGSSGGFIETSGAALGIGSGATVVARGDGGPAGAWLIDPTNLTVDAAAAATISGALDAGTGTTLQTTASGATGAGVASSGDGDITIAAPVSWGGSGVLTLDAWHSIAINAPVTIGGAGGLALLTNRDGGTSGTLSFAGGVQYTGAPNSGQSLTINGQGYELLYSMADLQGINTDARLSGRYALARSLDASAIPANGLGEWIPLGTNGAGVVLNAHKGFAGAFTGLGNTISNLTVDIGDMADIAGLFGYSRGAISDIGLIGGSVTGHDQIGGLVGAQLGGSITQAYATGTVTGYSAVGGLVGELDAGSITQAYATGAVTGIADVGGLVGYQFSSISQAYATGTVTGTIRVGGLVGYQDRSSITQAYATGAVTGTDSLVGGLVGYQYSGTITQAYATGAVNGGSEAGGLVGEQYDSTISQVYATGAVAGTADVGGLVGYHDRSSIAEAYATGAVTGGTNVGGLVGYQFAGSITDSYFDSYSTGQSASNGVGSVANASGVTSVTSDPTKSGDANYAYSQSAYANLTFTTTPGDSGWYMIDGQTRPFGAWEYSRNIVNGHQLQLVNMDLAASYTLARDLDLAGEFGRAGVASPTPEQSAGMWNRGFVPLGTDGTGTVLNGGLGFAGNFNGLGNAIDDLHVDVGSTNYAGLFGVSSGAISDIGLTGVNISGGQQTGGLAGLNQGTITHVSVSGAVVGDSPTSGSLTVLAGGLTGLNSGTIAQSFSTATVTLNGLADNTIFAGGLAGQSSGAITDSFASGDITATGVTSGTTGAGGLVGQVLAGGTLTRVFASGDVSALGLGPFPTAGGLVADNAGAILQAYATGATTESDPAGIGAIGALVARNWGSISQTYATGLVNTGVNANGGGLVGTNNLLGATITASFWDPMTTAQSGSVGGSPLATATFQDTEGFMATAEAAGWNFADIWAPSSTGFYPELYSLSPVVWLDVDDVAATYGDAPALTATPHGGPGKYVFGPSGGLPDFTSTLAATGYPGGGVGTYTITTSAAGSFTGSGGVNYRIVSTDGTLTVTPRALTVTANDASKTYGETAMLTGFTASGLQNGESIGAVTLTSPGAAASASVAGSPYAITASNAGGGTFNPANYTITYADGHLTVTPRALTVSADNMSRVYGDANPALTWSLTGGSLASFDTAGAVFSGALATTAGLTSDVGNYAIDQGTLAASSNYALTFNPGTLSVTPRVLTVSADDQSRVYGDANPALTFGVIGGDGLASFHADLAAASYGLTTDAVTISNVGDYGITLTGTNANYAMTFTPGTLAVTPRAITVTADDQSRLLGQPDPELTWALTGGSLAAFDTVGTVFSGGLTRDLGEAVGAYAIGQGSLAANANYTLGFVGGVLTIDPAAITQGQVLERSLAGQSFFIASSDADGSKECAEGILGPVCAVFVNPGNRDLGPNISWQAP